MTMATKAAALRGDMHLGLAIPIVRPRDGRPEPERSMAFWHISPNGSINLLRNLAQPTAQGDPRTAHGLSSTRMRRASKRFRCLFVPAGACQAYEREPGSLVHAYLPEHAVPHQDASFRAGRLGVAGRIFGDGREPRRAPVTRHPRPPDAPQADGPDEPRCQTTLRRAPPGRRPPGR